MKPAPLPRLSRLSGEKGKERGGGLDHSVLLPRARFAGEGGGGGLLGKRERHRQEYLP